MRGLAVVGTLVLFLAAVGTAHALPAGAADEMPTLPDAEALLPDEPTGGEGLERAAGSGGGALGPDAGSPSIPTNDLFDASTFPFALAFTAVGVLSLLGFGLYQGARLSTPDEVLKNEVRGRIYAYLRENVGANLKQVTDDLDLTTTNAIWHLRKLEDAGLIHSRRFNGFKVFYPAEGGVKARKLSLSLTALSNDNARNVFEYVVANPGTHQREIARALDVNHGTVRWHLKKLRRAEILTESRQGKASVYFPTDVGLEALQNMEAQRNGRVIPDHASVA